MWFIIIRIDVFYGKIFFIIFFIFKPPFYLIVLIIKKSIKSISVDISCFDIYWLHYAFFIIFFIIDSWYILYFQVHSILDLPRFHLSIFSTTSARNLSFESINYFNKIILVFWRKCYHCHIHQVLYPRIIFKKFMNRSLDNPTENVLVQMAEIFPSQTNQIFVVIPSDLI